MCLSLSDVPDMGSGTTKLQIRQTQPAIVVKTASNAEAGSEFLIDAFEPGRDIHAVADHRIAHALRRTDIADDYGVAVDADAQVERPQLLFHPARIKGLHAPLDAQCGDTGVPSMVVEQCRRSPERHHAV